MPVNIVVVGGGAGGLELATGLGQRLGRKGTARITLVDANATHIWKPLLHEVAAGSMSTSENEVNYVAQAKWNDFEFQVGRLCAIDRKQRLIHLAPLLDESSEVVIAQRSLSYDYLVIAIGSKTNDFGTQGAQEHCLFLDTTEQAERFHRQLLNHYLGAHANAYTGANQKITVGIVGAGATGVELAAELRNSALELSAYGLHCIKPEDMHITILEAGPKVLPALPDRIGGAVQKALAKLNVDVLTSSAVKEVTAEGFKTHDGTLIPATLKVWAAGICAPAFLKDLGGLEANRINQLVVRPTLQTTFDERIYAIGDCAACSLGEGLGNVPPRAQSAHQQASLLVKSFAAQIKGSTPLTYRYKDYGSLISLSHFTAVGNLMGSVMGSVKVEGWLAKCFYVSLYRMHQVALFGLVRTGLRVLGDRIGSSTKTRLKLH
ncbi:NADH dehydrogenase [Pseudomonas syringae]|uniref:NADH dehydrogenase n=1 Tax=Pseudomonas syringae TaxID=317 RepID=A0A1C7YX53_PSESX|nr:NAD(P)/FAD-dependent oxidoreductase [Pseudomonas syringae]OCR22083.1 NADH dehydrogenase [Pseudomonas syringae]